VGSTDGLMTRCSFCGKPYAEAGTVVAGPGVYICDACVELARLVIADSPPRQEGDPQRVHRGPDPRTDEYLVGMSDEDMLAMLPRQVLTVEQAERDLRAWVRLLRDRGVTWARIGEALGVSRQAAWDRFAADIAEDGAGDRSG
jgi:ClpX C4-type zinc finger